MTTGDGTHFGRDARLVPIGRSGRWSIVCAVAALVLVIAALIVAINVPSDAPEWESDISTGAGILVYLVVAPLLHVGGLVLGIRGLVKAGDSKVLSVIGILLNVALFVAGFFLFLAAFQTIGAFT